MAIVATDPADWQQANVVQVDSDAASNDAAIREIDDWAAEKGFARTTEYWLRRIFKEDRRWVFRGICYRMTREVIRSCELACETTADIRSSMISMPHRIEKD